MKLTELKMTFAIEVTLPYESMVNYEQQDKHSEARRQITAGITF